MKDQENNMPFRIGSGYDVHALAPGLPMWVCGIRIDHEKGCVAHSDGDAPLHALCDAMLGALALGDIGQHFPDTSAKYKGIDSKILLKEVYDLIVAHGYRIGNLDITVALQRPKLAPHIESMRSTIAATVSAVQSFADGTLKLWNSGATYRATLKTAASANRTQTTADATGTLPIITSGTGVIRVGQVTLEAGTATVTDTQTTASTRVILTPYGTPAPGAGNLTNTYGHVSNSAGASFVVRANLEDGTINNLDTSTLNYIAIG